MWPLGIYSIGGWPIVSPTHFEHWRVPGPWFSLPHLCPPLIHSPNPLQQVSAIPSLTSNPHITSRVAWFVCAMVCFVPSPPTISSTHPIHPERSQPFLCSCLILTSHQEWTWLGLCALWFALSHLPPPSHPLTQSTPMVSAIPSLMSNPHLASRVAWFVCTMVCFVPSPPTISSTHPIHPDRSQPFLCLHQVLTLHQSLPWLALSPSSPNTLFANLPSQSLHSALACWL